MQSAAREPHDMYLRLDIWVSPGADHLRAPYLAVYPQHEQHGEEQNGPERRHRQLGYSLWVGQES